MHNEFRLALAARIYCQLLEALIMTTTAASYKNGQTVFDSHRYGAISGGRGILHAEPEPCGLFSERVRVVVLCFIAFVICSADRINLSVAIIPIARDLGWNQSVVGIIQGSFYVGYTMTQVSVCATRSFCSWRQSGTLTARLSLPSCRPVTLVISMVGAIF